MGDAETEAAEWFSPLIKAAKAGIYFFAHLLIATAIIALIEYIQRLIIFAGDPKMFDLLPIRYIFDAMDLGILVAFAVFGTLEAYIVFKG
jgi:hypothetical protein